MKRLGFALALLLAASAACADFQEFMLRREPGGGYVIGTNPEGLRPGIFYRFRDSSGTTTTDLIGADIGNYVGGFTLGEKGPGYDPATAVKLNGTTGYVDLLGVATSHWNVCCAVSDTFRIIVEVWYKPYIGQSQCDIAGRNSSSNVSWAWRIATAQTIPGESIFNAVVSTAPGGNHMQSGIPAKVCLTGEWCQLVIVTTASTTIGELSKVEFFINGALAASGTTIEGTPANDDLAVAGEAGRRATNGGENYCDGTFWLAVHYPGDPAAGIAAQSNLSPSVIEAHWKLGTSRQRRRR